MVRVIGLDVPPEHQRDFYHHFSRHTRVDDDLLTRRRDGAGPITPGRKLVRMRFLEAIRCWHMQSASDKEDWFNEAMEEGWDRYYNYFMHKTLSKLHEDITPEWCKLPYICFPFTGLREYSQPWPYEYDETFPLTISPGDTFSIKCCLAASQLAVYEYEEWGETYYDRDTLTFRIEGYPQGATTPPFNLQIQLSADELCQPYWTVIDSDPGMPPFPPPRHDCYLFARGPNFLWPACVFTTQIPEFMPQMDFLRVYLSADTWVGYTYDITKGLFWLHDFNVYHNEASFWNHHFDPPTKDPDPTLPVDQFIMPRTDPWTRYERPEATCDPFAE